MASLPFELKGKRVFVAGHRGMVGSAIVRRLARENVEVLTAPRGELDLLDQAARLRVAGDLDRALDVAQLLRDPQLLFRDLVSGGISALVTICYAMSFAAMIFAGDLAPRLDDGVRMALLSAGVTVILVALTSPFYFAMAGPDSRSAAVQKSLGVALFARLRLVMTHEYEQQMDLHELDPCDVDELFVQQGHNVFIGAFAALASYALSARVLNDIKSSGVTKFGFVGNDKYRNFGK